MSIEWNENFLQSTVNFRNIKKESDKNEDGIVCITEVLKFCLCHVDSFKEKFNFFHLFFWYSVISLGFI